MLTAWRQGRRRAAGNDENGRRQNEPLSGAGGAWQAAAESAGAAMLLETRPATRYGRRPGVA